MKCKDCSYDIPDEFFAWMETPERKILGKLLFNLDMKKDYKDSLRLMWRQQRCPKCMKKWIWTEEGIRTVTGLNVNDK
jgi:hypothetical protein